MSGHGHVTENPNGVKARCGGPAFCNVCALEAAQAKVTADDIELQLRREIEALKAELAKLTVQRDNAREYEDHWRKRAKALESELADIIRFPG